MYNKKLEDGRKRSDVLLCGNPFNLINTACHYVMRCYDDQTNSLAASSSDSSGKTNKIQTLQIPHNNQ